MFLTWRFPNQAKTARHDGRNDIPHVGDFCSNTTDSAVKSMSGRKKTRVDLIVSNGQSQLPSQLQLSCVVAGDANLQSLSKMAADRLCDRIRSNHAVELVVRDAHDRPPHRDEGVRPARIRDALFLARVRLFALILDVEFRFGPAQVTAEIRFPRKRPCRRACEYLVVHTRNAQPMTPVHHRQTESERLLGFARGCRIVGQVACDARHFSRTAQRRITSCPCSVDAQTCDLHACDMRRRDELATSTWAGRSIATEGWLVRTSSMALSSSRGLGARSGSMLASARR